MLPAAPVSVEVKATHSGAFLAAVDAEALGRTAVLLGAGRVKKGDPIDPSTGIEFYPKIGDRLESGRPIAKVHAHDDDAARTAAERVLGAVTTSDEAIEAPPLVLGWHGADGGR